MQQDLAPLFRLKILNAIYRKDKLNVLDWPGNSAELNPFENFWSKTKSPLPKWDSTTTTMLILAMVALISKVEQITTCTRPKHHQVE